MRHISLIIAVLALAIAAPAIAGKGGNGGGGNGGGGGTTSDQGGGPNAYSPSLGVTLPEQLTATSSSDTTYVVSGCGYDASYGTVTVVAYSPVSAAWTSVSVDGGCVSVSMFDTQGAGNYRVDAWQHVKNRDVVVASTSFVVP